VKQKGTCETEGQVGLLLDDCNLLPVISGAVAMPGMHGTDLACACTQEGRHMCTRNDPDGRLGGSSCATCHM